MRLLENKNRLAPFVVRWHGSLGPSQPTAKARRGAPLPPVMLIGNAIMVAPRGGNLSTLRKFSKPEIFFPRRIWWTLKSLDGPGSIDAVSMPKTAIDRLATNQVAASGDTPEKKPSSKKGFARKKVAYLENANVPCLLEHLSQGTPFYSANRHRSQC